MTRIKKYLRFSILTFTMFFVIMIGSLYAYSFTDLSIKIAQGYTTLTSEVVSKDTNWSSVKLTAITPDAVTFSVRAKTNGSWDSYSSGVIYWKEDKGKTVVVPYKDGNTVAKGTTVQARVRNHNWSLNSNKISGTYSYSAFE